MQILDRISNNVIKSAKLQQRIMHRLSQKFNSSPKYKDREIAGITKKLTTLFSVSACTTLLINVFTISAHAYMSRSEAKNYCASLQSRDMQKCISNAMKNKIIVGQSVVTITRYTGLDSSAAMIDAETSYDDAKEYCYRSPGTPGGLQPGTLNSCIKDFLNRKRVINLQANCKTGVFRDPYEERLLQFGRFLNFGEYRPSFKDLRNNEVLDGSNASGVPFFLNGFYSLCPSRAPYS